MPAVFEFARGMGVFVAFSVLQAGLGLLWVQRRIGPNSVLGFRTVRTMSDPEFWYDTHRFWGWTQVVCAAVSLAGLSWGAAELPPQAAFQMGFAIVGVPMVLSVVAVWVYLARGSDGESSPGH